MTLPVVLSAEVQTLSGTTWTVTIPSSATGDLIYVTLNCNAGTGVQNVVTPPSGWTQVFDSDLELTGNGWQEAWYIVRGAGTPAGAFTMLSSRAGRAHVMVVDAGTFDATTVIEDSAKASQSSSTAWAIPAVDAAGDALLVAATACAGTGPTWTPDPTYTEQTDHANGTTSSMGTGTRAISGGTGLTATWTPSAADNGTTSHVVIKGAGGGGGGVSAYDTLVLAHSDLETYYPLATSGDDLQGTADGVAVDVTFGAAAVISSPDAKDESAEFNGVSGGVIPSGTASYADEVTADSPVHHWRAGEASGTLIDGPGSADGTASGTMTRNVTGLINAADDDGAVDLAGGYFDLADAMAGLDTTWTVEGWLRVDDVTDGGYILYLFDSTGGTNILSLGYGLTGIPSVRWTDNVGTGRIFEGLNALTVGQTYHLAATHDGSVGSLYINGVLNATATSWGSRSYGASDFNVRRIGAPNVTGSATHNGVVDEVAVYDTALSASRILAHYNAGVAGAASIPALGDTWSVELWVYPTAETLTDREYFVAAHTGANAVLSLWRYDDGKLVLSWNDSTFTGHSIGDVHLAADQPHYVVATHDGTTGTLYHNGVVAAEAAFDSRDMDELTWKLGGWSASDQFVLAGRMQKVAIYSAALTLDDIRDHYELGTGGVVFGAIDSIAPAAQSEGTAHVVYHATSDVVHAVPELAGEIETEESALSAVGASIAIEYDVRAAVGRSLAIAYDVAITTVAGSYRLSAPYRADMTYRGDPDAPLLTAVGRSLAISYNVHTVVGKSVAVAWNVRAAVGRDLTLRYNVLAIVVLEPFARFEIDWDGSGFEPLEVTEDMSFSWSRGAGTDLESQTPGSATLILHNDDDRYTDTNTASDLYTRIRPNARFRSLMDFDGNLRPLWSGYLSEMAPNMDIPQVELVFDDLLHRLSTIEVNVPPEVGRTFGEYRLEVLTAAGVPAVEISLDDENEVMVDTEGSGSGTALSLLEAVNAATGTRHFIRPGATDPWQQYVTVNRQHKLTQAVFDIDLHKTPQIHVGSGGWRTAWDTVVNRQRISVPGEVQYAEEEEEIWVADNLPIQIEDSTEVWALDTGPIADVRAIVFGTNLTTQVPTAYGDSVKIVVTANPGGGQITSLALWGRPGNSIASTTIIEENAASLTAYGRHDGPARNASGTLPSTAKGTAEHIVWRYGEPRKQPRATHSDPPAQYVGRDLFDLVGFNMTAVFVSDRRMELIGEDGSLNRGLLTLTWQMQDTPEQDPSTWFILGTSALNSTAKLAY